jgi:hypothetical protein
VGELKRGWNCAVLSFCLLHPSLVRSKMNIDEKWNE